MNAPTQDIPILYEDDNYIIFNKPAGLVVHSDGRTEEPTLADWLIKNRPEMKDVGEPLISSSSESGEPGKKILRPGIVHRLDRETSGAIVVAKNADAFADLKLKFQNREVVKKYHAFVYGHIKEDDGTISRPIGRSKNDFRKWSAQRGARGEMREAITNYKTLVRGNDVTKNGGRGENATGENATFVEVEPRTGRTHQIRVHFKAIHHPVVADSLYAPNQLAILGFKRLALHAVSISFVGLGGENDGKLGGEFGGLSGKGKISADAPYPADFVRAIELIKKSVKS
ncbi:MAG: RluA family pseudouridine synthase [Patescibacteria group bacterium]